MMDMASQGPTSALDRRVFSSHQFTWRTAIYGALVVFIVFTRLWDLASRGYSHDESIHAWESWKLVTGQGYSHSPVYHGPFPYHFTGLIFALFGHTDFAGRLSPALFGIVLTLLPLLLRKQLGEKGLLATTLLMAFSPVMMHRSRFLRHDVYAVVANLILFITILRYLEHRKQKDLYWIAGAVSLGFCAKETTFITYALFGTFLFGLLLSHMPRLWKSTSGRRLARLRDLIRRMRGLAVFDLVMLIGTLILPLAAPIPIRLLGGDPVDYSQSGVVFSGAVFLGVLAVSVAAGLWWNWRRWLVCAAIFYGIFIPLFTTMFTNGKGFATGTVGQLGYWLSQQEIKRGGQPWFYYLVVMPMYEFLPLIVGGAGVVYYGVKRIAGRKPDTAECGVDAPSLAAGSGVPFVPMLIYWFLGAFVLYSVAGEKMPWLTMNLALPLQLLAGWTLGRLLEADWRGIRQRGGLWLLILVPLFLYTLVRLWGSKPFSGTSTDELGRSMAWLTSLIVAAIAAVPIATIVPRLGRRDALRTVAVSLIVILLALTLRFAWMATFINSDIATEFLVYAQGTPDVALVTRELETLSRRLTGGLHMKVAYDDDSSWPFVWYLRDFDNAQFYGKKPGGPFDAEVVIVGPDNEAGIKPLLGNKYYRRQYRLIWWPNQDFYMNMTPDSLLADLKDAAAREKLWNVLFYRKHEASLTSWPYVHNFAMYIRRDVVQQLWDYGPEALVAAGPLPGDEYVEAWKSRQAEAVWGSEGSGPGQFRAPKGLDLDADGNIYVADSQNHRIQVLDANGAFLRQWGEKGSGSGQLNEPWGVAVGPDGDVYVADTWNHRVQVFDAQGAYKRMWGTFGEVKDAFGSGEILYGPRDLVFDDEGNLYLSDTGNKRVVKYDKQGRMLGAAGGVGDADGQMQEPVGIGISAQGSIFVADTWNQRVQIFDKQLNFVRKWQVYAWEGMSVVNKPGLAVGESGSVYISDPEGYRVLKLDDTGKVLAAWGQNGSDMSSMNLPTGIALDSSVPGGRILVTDSDNNRVLVFSGN